MHGYLSFSIYVIDETILREASTLDIKIYGITLFEFLLCASGKYSDRKRPHKKAFLPKNPRKTGQE